MKLQFVKFFDVKSPQGLEQNEKERAAQFHSVGVDLYMPPPTREFVDELIKSNKNYDFRVCPKSKFNESTKQYDSLFIRMGMFDSSTYIEYVDGTYEFITSDFNNGIQIPCGIGVLIPEGYHIDLRPKSSNFNNSFNTVVGLIDCNFTYQIGAQLLTRGNISMSVNEKFAQLVMVKSEYIDSLDEISMTEWNTKAEVLARRENRKGGFGSTGKF